LVFCIRASVTRNGSGQRIDTPSGGSGKSSGTTIWMRPGSIATDAELSTVSATHLKPTHTPE
jgi:hypothetical protein